MKFLLAVVALFAALACALAEPEPEAYRGYYGYGGYRGYGGYYGRGYGYYRGKRSADAEPEAEADAVAQPEADAEPWGYGYYGHPYRYFGKRSADAEPEAEADAWRYGYGGYYVDTTAVLMDTDTVTTEERGPLKLNPR